MSRISTSEISKPVVISVAVSALSVNPAKADIQTVVDTAVDTAVVQSRASDQEQIGFAAKLLNYTRLLTVVELATLNTQIDAKVASIKVVNEKTVG